MVLAIFVFGRNCILCFRFLFRFRRKSQTKIRKSLICAAALYRFKAGRRTITIGDCVVNWSQCDVGPGLDIFIASPDSPLLLRHIQAARSYVHRGHSTPQEWHWISQIALKRVGQPQRCTCRVNKTMSWTVLSDVPACGYSERTGNWHITFDCSIVTIDYRPTYGSIMH